jgi:iron complex outermembrane receptor protein
VLNVTAFHTKVKNYQANQSLGVGRGGEASSPTSARSRRRASRPSWRPGWSPGLHTKGFVAYDKATYSSFHNSACPAHVDRAHLRSSPVSQVAWAPKWTADFTDRLHHPRHRNG